MASKSELCYNLLMQKLRTSFRKLIYNLKHGFFTFENVSLAIAIILCLGWTYGAINSMSRSWQLTKKLQEKEYESTILGLEIESLKLENTYYSSKEFQELSARQKLNKKLEGETMVYLPKNSEEAKTKHQKTEKAEKTTNDNVSEWLEFLFGI